jgi:hypothetical protein
MDAGLLFSLALLFGCWFFGAIGFLEYGIVIVTELLGEVATWG